MWGGESSQSLQGGLRRSEEGIRWVRAQWKQPRVWSGPLTFINVSRRAVPSSVLCDSACLPTQGEDGDKLHQGKEIRLLLELLETTVGREKSKRGLEED